MPDVPIRTITESELKIAVDAGHVSGGKAIETARGFELVFIVAGLECYLVSRRTPDVSRAFRTFESLTAKYRTMHPDGVDMLTVHFSEPFEPMPSMRRRASSKIKTKGK